VLTPQLRSNRIQLVGKTVGCVSRQNVIIQIETALIYDRLFSNQVEVISGHAMTMRHTKGCSK